MALTWDDKLRRDEAGNILGVGYTAHIPHWGEARIYPHIHHPGEMFLDCLALGIDTYPLGRVTAEDTLSPAERVLMKTLEQYGIWCVEALVAIGTPEN